MVSTFTPNVNFELPARGDYVGTWDTPVNANETLADLIVGGTTTISGAAGSVVLSAAQFQCKTITFNSTLLASIVITFPTSFKKSYEIYHNCTGSSAFTITLQTTAGGQVICAVPGEIIEVMNDGSNLKYKNLGRIGSYWDYAGSSVPNWVFPGCSVAPYLNCDGTAFSSATFPVLATILGGTTLPDIRGVSRATLNQGTGRITSSQSGIDGNTNLSRGGSQTVTLGTSNLPAYTPSGNVAVLSRRDIYNGSAFGPGIGGFTFDTPLTDGTGTNTNTAVTATFTGSPQGGVSNPVNAMGPTTISGITMIRSG